MRKVKKWMLKRILYDDYSVRATKHDDIRENIHTFSTPWLCRAIMMYVCFNIRYRDCTIVFTHYRYEKGRTE